MDSYDVVIVGGGPAGLAAALWVSRYRLSNCLFDSHQPRNASTWAVHGYLGVRDPSPDDLRRIGRDQALAAGAKLVDGVVTSVEGEIERFVVKIGDGGDVRARRVLFATGLRDIIPEIPGLTDFYGSSIWHCPDCDGPGVAGLRVGVIGWGRRVAAFCMEMLTWTDRLMVLTHGRAPELPDRSRTALERFGIPVRTAPITNITGAYGQVERVVFADGTSERFDALFFNIAYGPGCTIPADIGCLADQEGILEVDRELETSVPGVFAAGDITRGAKLAIRAAADGTRAGIGLFRSLLPEERRV